jgi:hypothetical protein
MSHRKAAVLCAVAFFLVWTTVAGAMADKPSPPGFLLLVAIFGCLAVLVYFRVQSYLVLRNAGVRMRVARVSLEGFAAGVCVAAALAMTGGEPSVAPSALDRAIWVVVLGALGTVSAMIVYTAAANLAARDNGGT